MEWVEVTGKTVEEAREKALDLLGVADEDAEVEVLGEAKMGLFGRLREEARVRARVLPSVPRAKDDGRRRRGNGRPAKDATAAGSDARPPAGGGRASGAADRGRSRPAAAAAAADDAKMGATMTDTPASDQLDRVEVPVAEQAEVAKQFVEGLLGVMGVNGASTTVELLDEETAEVQVTGSDLGLLIGPKGATLLALQDLARTVVQRQTGARTGRLLLDVAGYRHKRKEALERFTQKVASEVAATGTPTALEPMSSADRKIVHDTVNAIDGVTTTSEGEDPRRRVVVRPA